MNGLKRILAMSETVLCGRVGSLAKVMGCSGSINTPSKHIGLRMSEPMVRFHQDLKLTISAETGRVSIRATYRLYLIESTSAEAKAPVCQENGNAVLPTVRTAMPIHQKTRGAQKKDGGFVSHANNTTIGHESRPHERDPIRDNGVE